MIRDDSDLSSLSNEDGYQGDNGSEMDDNDEDQDDRLYHVECMTELGEPKKDILDYFAFRFRIANTLIHGLLKKPSPTPSLTEDENDEPPPKHRVTT
ncbi:hypothetical protein TNCV_4839931 [Trichonephila clavipes]|nr:hypothetical protein TNCV_4839931 [Trichonephila clavipes]